MFFMCQRRSVPTNYITVIAPQRLYYIVLNLTDNMDPFELDKEFQM